MKPSLYLDEDTMATALVVALRARGADIQTVIKEQIRLLLDLIKRKSAEELRNALYFL